MLSALGALLDPYSRRARFQPVIWSLFPILVVVVLLIPEFHGFCDYGPVGSWFAVEGRHSWPSWVGIAAKR